MSETRLKRDALQKQIDVLLDLVTEGTLATKAAGPRLTAHQHEIDQFDLRTAEIEGRLAAARISKGQIEAVEEILQRGLEGVADQPWEDQKAIVAGLVKRVDIAAGAPLRIALGVPLGQVRTDVREWCAI